MPSPSPAPVSAPVRAGLWRWGDEHRPVLSHSIEEHDQLELLSDSATKCSRSAATSTRRIPTTPSGPPCPTSRATRSSRPPSTTRAPDNLRRGAGAHPRRRPRLGRRDHHTTTTWIACTGSGPHRRLAERRIRHRRVIWRTVGQSVERQRAVRRSPTATRAGDRPLQPQGSGTFPATPARMR